MQTIHNFTEFCKKRNLDFSKTFIYFSNLLKESNIVCWIAGGSVRRVLMGEKEVKSDIDVFVPNKEAFSLLEDFLLKKGFQVLKSNDNNITFQFQYEDKKAEIQLISAVFGESIENILDEFDYTICQFAINPKDINTLYCSDSALFDLARKRLVINKITYPVASLRRLIKYTFQGFYACEGCLQEFLQISQNLTIDDKVKYID